MRAVIVMGGRQQKHGSSSCRHHNHFCSSRISSRSVLHEKRVAWQHAAALLSMHNNVQSRPLVIADADHCMPLPYTTVGRA